MILLHPSFRLRRQGKLSSHLLEQPRRWAWLWNKAYLWEARGGVRRPAYDDDWNVRPLPDHEPGQIQPAQAAGHVKIGNDHSDVAAAFKIAEGEICALDLNDAEPGGRKKICLQHAGSDVASHEEDGISSDHHSTCILAVL